MIPVRLTEQAPAPTLPKLPNGTSGKSPALAIGSLIVCLRLSTKIAANPQGYAVVFEKLRRTNLRQFPYALFFQIRSDNSLVVACLHHRRSPQLAKDVL